MFQWLRNIADLERRSVDYTNLEWLVVAATAAGIGVTPETGLRSPTCLASVRVIAFHRHPSAQQYRVFRGRDFRNWHKAEVVSQPSDGGFRV